MANFDQLKQSVAALIRTNGAEEITGQIMQDVLLTIINSISGGYMFGGVAQHSGNVGNPDYNVFYLAGSGAYTGYGDAINIPNGCYGVFRYNGSWTQDVVDIGVHLTGTIREGETNGVTGDVINTALQQLFNNVMNILDTLTFTYNTPSAQQATKAMLDVIVTPTGGASHVLTTLTLVSATAAAAGLMSAEDKQKVDRMLTDFRSLSFSDTTAVADQATKIVQTLSATLGENPEAITTMTFLAATASKAGLLSAADKAKLDALWSSGYQFVGIATPSTTPVSTTSKIFYIATEAGTYFNTVTVTQGINIIYKSGDTWSVAQVVGIDNEPTAGSDRLVKSGGVFDELALGAVYDVSAKNPTAGPNSNGKWESLSALLSDANLNTLIPTSVRKGGMSIKYVQSSDNKYVQYRLMANQWSTSVGDWEKETCVDELNNKTGEIREIANITDDIISAFSVNIKNGSGFYWKITGVFSRVIINYNGSNNNRLVDSNYVEVLSGKWYYKEVPANITQLGIWLTGTDATGLTFSIRMFDKSYLEAAPELYGKFNLQKNGIVEKKSVNLFNYDNRTQNTILDGDTGDVTTNSSYYTSDYIAVKARKTYSFLGYVRRGFLYDSYKRPIMSSVVNNQAQWQFTPMVDGFMRFSAANSGTDYTVIEGSTSPTSPIQYKETIQENVFLSDTLKNEIIEMVSGGGKLELDFEDDILIFKQGTNQIKTTINAQELAASPYNTNPIFAFLEYTYNGHTQATDDETAPVHIFGTTIGADHGQPCQKLTITGHGLGNADVGKYLTLSGTSEKYYIVRIVDANNIWILGENTSSDPAYPTFRTLSGQSATLTLGGNTYNVTAISSAQIKPFIKNVSHKIFDKLGNEITIDGVYSADYYDIVESYDILYAPSVLANLIEDVGTTTDPVYDGDSALTVKNTYRFLPNLSVLVFATIIPRMNIKFADAMFSQAVRIGGITSTKYYLPGSVPGNSYDLTRPLTVPFGSSYPGINVSKNEYWPDASSPVDRVLQFTTEHGFAIGIIPTLGVGKDIIAYTDQTFEIRGSSGKIYPHPVSSTVVGNLAIGKIYNAAMFRAFIPNNTMDNNTIGIYGYELDGHYYLYAEFSNTIVKEIPISNDYDGRSVEVVDSCNCELLTDICNGCVAVSATSVTGETSYIIVKI